MKKLILIGACLFLTSCFDRNLELTSSPPIVVDKRTVKNNILSPYKIKVFYGKDIEWYSTYQEDFENINVGDTLKNFRVF